MLSQLEIYSLIFYLQNEVKIVIRSGISSFSLSVDHSPCYQVRGAYTTMLVYEYTKQSPQLDEWLRSMTPDVTFTTLYCFILLFFVRNVSPHDFATGPGENI